MKLACIIAYIVFSATLLGMSLLFGVCIEKEGEE